MSGRTERLCSQSRHFKKRRDNPFVPVRQRTHQKNGPAEGKRGQNWGSWSGGIESRSHFLARVQRSDTTAGSVEGPAVTDAGLKEH